MTMVVSCSRRVRARALRTSAILFALVVGSPAAFAQCAPEPTQPGGTTTCTGVDTDGVRVTTDGSTVQVAASATVTGLNGPAIGVDILAQTGIFGQRTSTITVAGSVDGGAQGGISVVPGTVPSGSFDSYGTHVTVTVAAGGTVTGATGITVGSSPGNSYGAAVISLNNAGTITGTGGVALLATDPAHGGFDVITNAASGSIAGISGAVGQLTNAGAIDGGTRSAIDQTTTYNSIAARGAWTNSGTIQSSSSAATIANLSQLQSLTNSGTISNAGTGAAVQGNNLTITNLAGGQIATAGSTAIAGTSAVTLTNAGTITGNVVADPAQGTGFFSTIDSTVGSIIGNVSLGRGNDLIYARYDGTETLVTGITGTLDGGGGTNSVVLAPTADLTVSTAITIPGSFQRLRLAPASGATVTLASGFVAPGTIELAGSGAVVNDASITTTGQAFVRPYDLTDGTPSLTNNGSIYATVVQGYDALSLNTILLTNNGTIQSSGNGVGQSSGALSNTGSIVAMGTAVSQFDSKFNNSGLIRSTGGIGIELTGNTDNSPAINSGRIEGATYGAVIGYVLTNSGTIAATGSGTAVGLSNYGVLNNLAGGVISGGAYAITGQDPYGSTSVYNGTVFNAGTINGDVTFVSSRTLGYNNANTFVALSGGVLNGNLALGTGDTLVTDLVNTGSGSFAGINGTVTSNGGLLRYRVTGEASAVIGAVGPFATTGYELVDGARLTLTAAAPQTLPIILAGSGTVDLSADVNVANQPALSVVAAATVPGCSPLPTSGLVVINRGTLAGTTTDYYAGANAFGVVVLGSNNTLDNEGTIKAAFSATNGGQSYNAAIAFGGSLINNGRIELDGSYGTYNVSTVTNTGTVVQTGPGVSIGIQDAASVTNSGTIQTAGVAINGGYGTVITNSGTIASTGTIAIGGGLGLGWITNLVGGTISGGGGAAAISMSGGAVVNAGTIIGDVDLHSFSGYQSAYYANGGTVAGNLALTGGDDLFLQGGTTTGISGTIDAGGGRDIYGRALSASGTVAVGPAPAPGFEDAMVAAFGANTVATVTGVDASFEDFYAVGDGTVVNQTALAGALKTSTPTTAMQMIVGDTLGTLINTGSIAGGVSGSVTHLINSGTIGSSSLTGPAIAVVNQGALSFVNNGQIQASPTGTPSYLMALDTLGATNTGTIDNGLMAYIDFVGQGIHGFLAVANSGTIRNTVAGAALKLGAIGTGTSAGGSISVGNSGSLTASSAASAYGLALTLDGSGKPVDYSVRNSGTIAAATSATTADAEAVGLDLAGVGTVNGTIVNTATGTISASGTNAVALRAQGTVLDLNNAGVISAQGAGALAILATGAFANSVVNTGTINGDVLFGAGDDSFTIAGRFTGSVDGGAGKDAIAVSSGSAAAPVAFGDIANVEAFGMTTGYATVSGTAALGAIDLTGGRLVGLSGSTITAPQILVRQGATFGSAGTVNGNITVAGTLSPGASPGTMTVNGNVALANGSVSLFELSSPVPDKLIVNGNVSIGAESTLKLTGIGTLQPGTTYDLILASGGITGSYSTIVKPDDLFGFVIQDAGRIKLLGEFADTGAFAPQVSRSIAYANATLEGQRAGSAFYAALPTLLATGNASNPQAFARLTPEPYASATQMGVDNGLALADVARGPAFATTGDTAHAYTFAASMGQWHRLGDDPRTGTSAARTQSYGFLGGIGFGDASWNVGAFGGYLNNQQYVDTLAARTKADGPVAGVQAQVQTASRFTFSASVSYDGSQAVTTRVLPAGSARGKYDLHSWVGDVTARYEIDLPGDWALRPQAGVTYIRTTRDGVAETGDSPFALTVARNRHVAGFGDAALSFGRSEASAAPLRPYVSFGVRAQIEGSRTDALASYAGGDLALEALGAPRARVVGTAAGGIAYRLPSGLDLFASATSQTGRDDHQESVSAGARLRF